MEVGLTSLRPEGLVVRSGHAGVYRNVKKGSEVRGATTYSCVSIHCSRILGAIFCPNSRAQQTQFQFLPETDAYYEMSSTVRLDFQAKETREAGAPNQAEIARFFDAHLGK